MKRNHAFKIVVAGEDFGAVLHAQEVSRQLAAELKPGVEISNDAWKFETLGNPQAGKAAAKEAAKADMVIIAAGGAAEPPAHVKSWIKSWLPQKRKGVAALVALLGHEDKTLHKSSPLCTYLRRIAGKWGMEFLTNSVDGSQHNFELPAETTDKKTIGSKWIKPLIPTTPAGLRFQ
jgi:hypothetical protein